VHGHAWTAAGYGVGMETYSTWSAFRCTCGTHATHTRPARPPSSNRQGGFIARFFGCQCHLCAHHSFVRVKGTIQIIRNKRLVVMRNEANIAQSRFAKQLTSSPSSEDQKVRGCTVRSDNRLGQVEANGHYSSPDSMPGRSWKHSTTTTHFSRRASLHLRLRGGPAVVK